MNTCAPNNLNTFHQENSSCLAIISFTSYDRMWIHTLISLKTSRNEYGWSGIEHLLKPFSNRFLSFCIHESPFWQDKYAIQFNDNIASILSETIRTKLQILKSPESVGFPTAHKPWSYAKQINSVLFEKQFVNLIR